LISDNFDDQLFSQPQQPAVIDHPIRYSEVKEDSDLNEPDKLIENKAWSESCEQDDGGLFSIAEQTSESKGNTMGTSINRGGSNPPQIQDPALGGTYGSKSRNNHPSSLDKPAQSMADFDKNDRKALYEQQRAMLRTAQSNIDKSAQERLIQANNDQ